jgi:acetyl-CoA carboxylase biotin carboxyl carrier protein
MDAIRRVIAAFEQSDWTEVDVRSGDVRVHLSTGSATGAASASPREPTPVGEPGPGSDVDDHDARPDAAGTSSPSAAAPPPGAHVVVAPSPGIFWRSPEPGAPPFADRGDTVDESTTVCIIEVMKLMSHLKAGIKGEVVAVYGENGVAVQKGQALFAIAPSGTNS